MNERVSKYGGREFTGEDINSVRRLVLGPVEVNRWCFRAQTDSLIRLKYLGLAQVVDVVDADSKYEVKTYQASDELLQLKARHEAGLLTFFGAALAWEKDLSDKAVRAIRRSHARPSQALARRVFPEGPVVAHRAIVEAQAPGFTVSAPVEYDDAFQFSSRGLTDWYVREFIKLNHLST